MSNSAKLSTEVDSVISELKNLKKELVEWKSEMKIKFELQRRIIKKVRDNAKNNTARPVLKNWKYL